VHLARTLADVWLTATAWPPALLRTWHLPAEVRTRALPGLQAASASAQAALSALTSGTAGSGAGAASGAPATFAPLDYG
ncbi:hypothetical protein OFC55_41760, partial [Escherichia coli]|nr:hypothetical protein [Escherichia coli]